MKKIIVVLFAAFAFACEPVAVCDEQEFPELCGSESCEQLTECCSGDDRAAVVEVCERVDSGLSRVPEVLRQPARDTACNETLTQLRDSGLCLRE